MLRYALLLLTALVTYIPGRAQEKTEPSILVLSPAAVYAAPGLSKELKQEEEELIKYTLKYQDKIPDNATETVQGNNNMLQMVQSVAKYIKHLTLFKQVALFSSQHLTYRFYERFPNELIVLQDTVSKGTIDDLQRMARSRGMDYVLNFPAVSFNTAKGEYYSRVKVQLYELSSNTFLLDKEYTGDWNSHGFEFTCKQASLGCTINNALSQALEDVANAVLASNPTIKRERVLAKQRATVLLREYYPQAWDASLLRQVIPATDSIIDFKNMYHCLYDKEGTKFVAFFIRESGKKGLKSLADDNNKENATIITSKDIHDPGYLDDIPRTYAYVVKGVNYRGKWYYVKDKVTYFEAKDLEEGKREYFNNLQQWGFFSTDSTSFDPGFWEGALFNKVPDRRKDPDWERYKDMMEAEERENRDYVGLYEMVADQLKKEREKADVVFAKQVSNNLLRPFYDSLAKARSLHISGYSGILDNFVLIYPADRRLILNPVLITDDTGVTNIRYFVFIPASGEIYEWLYFTPGPKQKEWVTDDITGQIGSITKWTFAYRTLDDANFWDQYVLAKEGGVYKYLKKLNSP